MTTRAHAIGSGGAAPAPAKTQLKKPAKNGAAAKATKAAGLDAKAKELASIVSKDPFAYPPAFEPLVGSLAGMYSRRINRQHRFAYEVIDEPAEHDGSAAEGTVKVLSMWTHYESL